MQVYHLSASVLLGGQRPRAAAVRTVCSGSESRSRALNHRPQMDSCVVLKENIQMLEQSDTFGGLLHPEKEGFLKGLSNQESSGSTTICVMLMTESGP